MHTWVLICEVLTHYSAHGGFYVRQDLDCFILRNKTTVSDAGLTHLNSTAYPDLLLRLPSRLTSDKITRLPDLSNRDVRAAHRLLDMRTILPVGSKGSIYKLASSLFRRTTEEGVQNLDSNLERRGCVTGEFRNAEPRIYRVRYEGRCIGW